jgi:RNA polymerase-binding transcription factor DksA
VSTDDPRYSPHRIESTAADFDKTVIRIPTGLSAQCKECGKPLPKRFIVDNGVTYCPACDEAGGGT